jgi:hypothetical protein
MAIAKKLGTQYESIRAQIRTKTLKIQLNDAEFELKIRIPVKREMDELTEKLTKPEAERVEKIYSVLAKPLKDSLQETDEDFKKALSESKELSVQFVDDDVIVNGTSVKQIAQFQAIWQNQVEKYFALIQTPTGEPVTESFDEISEEFPEEVIREIIKKIDEAIRPNYKDTKKN